MLCRDAVGSPEATHPGSVLCNRISPAEFQEKQTSLGVVPSCDSSEKRFTIRAVRNAIASCVTEPRICIVMTDLLQHMGSFKSRDKKGMWSNSLSQRLALGKNRA